MHQNSCFLSVLISFLKIFLIYLESGNERTIMKKISKRKEDIFRKVLMEFIRILIIQNSSIINVR